jgi:hypothetical protein
VYIKILDFYQGQQGKRKKEKNQKKRVAASKQGKKTKNSTTTDGNPQQSTNNHVPIEILQCHFVLASRLLHEIAHALQAARRLTRNDPERIIGDSRLAEGGYCLENWFFGGYLGFLPDNPKDQSAKKDATTLTLSEWPCAWVKATHLHGQGEIWVPPKEGDDEVRSKNSHTKTQWAIPDAWVRKLFTDEFWTSLHCAEKPYDRTSLYVPKLFGERRYEPQCRCRSHIRKSHKLEKSSPDCKINTKRARDPKADPEGRMKHRMALER